MTYYVSTDMYYYNDYLQHYGVPGMKWGRRKARIAAGFHKLAAKNYELNDRTYRKLGNKTMASMNKAAARDSYKKAATAKAKADAYQAQINKAKADKMAVKQSAKAERAKKGSSATANVLKTIGKQTVKGLAITTAGVALRKAGHETAGSFIAAYGAGTLAGTAVGGAIGLASARKIDKRNRTN